MFQAIPLDGHHIKAKECVSPVMGFHVLYSGFDHLFLFGTGNGFEGSGKIFTVAGPDLYKDEKVFLFHDQIQFSQGGAKIRTKEAVSLGF